MASNTRQARPYIPFEVLANICSFMSPTGPDICSFRLTSRAFCAAAKPYFYNAYSSPAEMFLEPSSIARAIKWYSKKNLFLSWTWLKMPEPTPSKLPSPRTGYTSDNDFVDYLVSFKRDAPGRKRLYYARIHEEPELLCIVEIWQSKRHWDSFRQQPEGWPTTQQFLETHVPGCGVSALDSWSDGALMNNRWSKTGFHSWCEIRTIYFPPTLTKEQKAVVEDALEPWVKHDRLGWSDGGLKAWCWLLGMRTYNGQPAVAARWVYAWQTQEQEQRYYDKVIDPGPGIHDYVKAKKDRVERFDRALNIFEANGMLGSEIQRATFQMGRMGYIGDTMSMAWFNKHPLAQLE